MRGELIYAFIQLYNNNTNLHASCLSSQQAPDTLFAVAETTPSIPVSSSHHWDRELTAGF